MAQWCDPLWDIAKRLQRNRTNTDQQGNDTVQQAHLHQVPTQTGERRRLCQNIQGERMLLNSGAWWGPRQSSIVGTGLCLHGHHCPRVDAHGWLLPRAQSSRPRWVRILLFVLESIVYTHSQCCRYLTIHKENIDPVFKEEFVVNNPENERILTPFDYNSVMLYGETAFSIDPLTKKTMEPSQPGFYMIEVCPLWNGFSL